MERIRRPGPAGTVADRLGTWLVRLNGDVSGAGVGAIGGLGDDTLREHLAAARLEVALGAGHTRPS